MYPRQTLTSTTHGLPFIQVLPAFEVEFTLYATSEKSGLTKKLSFFSINGGSKPFRFNDGDPLVPTSPILLFLSL